MGAYRGFVVWGAGSIIVLGAFLLFVANGWPGSPNQCTHSTPNTCFCEAYDLSLVQSHAPGVRQVVNTWFNLYALVTSFVVALMVFFDRRAWGKKIAPNLMRSSTFVPDLYIFAVLFLGLGSMWFHASLTQWGGIIDGASVYVFVAFWIFYSIRRIYPSAQFFWIGYIATVALFSYLHYKVPALTNVLILVGAYLVVEVYIWIRSGKIMQGRLSTVALWIAAIASILAATFFWVGSQTGNFMCDPDSFFQPHGLLWHPLAGVTAVLMYFYWRAANDPV